MRPLAWILAFLITVFMVGTVVIAIWQDTIGWGWWWTLPLGALFVAGLIGFRLLIQRADERARIRDAQLDALEHDSDAHGAADRRTIPPNYTGQ